MLTTPSCYLRDTLLQTLTLITGVVRDATCHMCLKMFQVPVEKNLELSLISFERVFACVRQAGKRTVRR